MRARKELKTANLIHFYTIKVIGHVTPFLLHGYESDSRKTKKENVEPLLKVRFNTTYRSPREFLTIYFRS